MNPSTPASARVRSTLRYTAIALAVLGVVQLVALYELLMRDLAHMVLTQAELVADNAAAAVVFEDETDAQALLESLQRTPQVMGATLATPQGVLAQVGQITRSQQIRSRSGSQAQVVRAPDHVIARAPLRADGAVVGTTWVQYSTASVWMQLGTFATLTLVACLAAWFTLAVIARRLAGAVDHASRRLEHLARVDVVTGLPNRRAFNQVLSERLAQDGSRTLIAIIDLDNFKDVNDGFGHAVGDKMLQTLGARLAGDTVRSSGVRVFRLGGDEFGVIAALSAHRDSPTQILRDIRRVLTPPLTVDQHQFQVAASIGACTAPMDGTEPEELFRKADTAMYEIKRRGKNDFCLYHPAIEQAYQERLVLTRELRDAVAAKELTLFYQPVINLQSGRIDGVEALLRWQHPGRGWVSPGVFIPLAESCGLIAEIGRWTLEAACEQAMAWQAAGEAPVNMAVNISMAHLLEPEFLGHLRHTLTISGLQPSRLKLEITESVLAESFDAVSARLSHIRALGVRLSVDDFGTGYSSLAYLPAFPVQELKIDKSFVSRLPGDGEPIVEAILRLAESFDMDVVAEGVETLEHLAYVRSAGCGHVQGFLFSPAVPPDELAELRRDFKLGDRLVTDTPAHRSVVAIGEHARPANQEM